MKQDAVEERSEIDVDIREILRKIEDRLHERDEDEEETPPAKFEEGAADETDEIYLVVLSGDVSADRTRERSEVCVFAENQADLENAEPGEREEIHRVLGRENDAQLEGGVEEGTGAEEVEDPVEINAVRAEKELGEGSGKKKKTRRFIKRKQWRRTMKEEQQTCRRAETSLYKL